MTRPSILRAVLRSRLLWALVLGLAFVGSSWVVSMQAARGVSWRWGVPAVFLATSDGSVRLGYEGRATREHGFRQWSIRRGDYENRLGDEGWFATPRITRDREREGGYATFPHWLLAALWAGGLAGIAAAGRRFRRARACACG